MIWYLTSAFLIVLVLALLIVHYISERRYLSRRASEVMRTEVKEELEEEMRILHARHEKFQKLLRKAMHGKD